MSVTSGNVVHHVLRELFKFEKSRATAVETFKQHRAQYHSIAAKLVGRDLGLQE